MPRNAWAFLTLLALAAASSTGRGRGASTPPLPQPDSFITTTSQQGSRLVLQNQTRTETVRLGLDTAWGGSIVEVSLNGTNFVNAHDTGREVQPAFYDGNAQHETRSEEHTSELQS